MSISPEQAFPMSSEFVKEKNHDDQSGEEKNNRIISEMTRLIEVYDKKLSDTKRLAEIFGRWQQDHLAEMPDDDLRFLYEIGSKIDGFDDRKDYWVYDLLKTRDQRQDLSQVLGCTPEQISFSRDEALGEQEVVYHRGHLSFLLLESAEGLNLPRIISGNLEFARLRNVAGANFPSEVGGNLNLWSLENVEGLNLPERVGGNLDLRDLRSAIGMSFPKEVGGNLVLRNLKNADGLALPERVGGFLNLGSLESAMGMSFPKEVDGDLGLSGLKNADGLALPERVGGVISMSRIVYDQLSPQVRNRYQFKLW